MKAINRRYYERLMVALEFIAIMKDDEETCRYCGYIINVNDLQVAEWLEKLIKQSEKE